jgi:hypothetical protein
MGRGDRPRIRWAANRRRKKLAREQKVAAEKGAERKGRRR